MKTVAGRKVGWVVWSQVEPSVEQNTGNVQPQQAFVDTIALARSAGTVSGVTPLSAFERLLEDQPDQAPDAQVAWQVQGEADGRGRWFLELTADTVVLLQCQRCLRPLEWPVHVRNRLEIVKSESDLDGEDEDQPERIVGSARFDLLELIQDEIILVLPYVPRHETCPGQTDAGTADSPQGDDAAPKRPSPFAALAKLKKD